MISKLEEQIADLHYDDYRIVRQTEANFRISNYLNQLEVVAEMYEVSNVDEC